MPRAVVLCLMISGLLFAACTPQPAARPVHSPGSLAPYTTATPSPTPEKPVGWIVTLETPLATPTPFTYTVQPGDTLSGIGLKFGVSLDELVAANPGISPNAMSVGMVLNIPSNPASPSSEATPTPVPIPVEQIQCYPSADRGMWCFVLAHNDAPDFLENIGAQVSLLDSDGQVLASAVAFSPLNILPPGSSLPLMVFFPPEVPAKAQPRVQILTGIRLLPGDERYLPATLHNILVEVDWSGRTAQVSGQVRLPENTKAASMVWVAAIAYDDAGRVLGTRRWESTAGIAPGGSLPFTFAVSSLGGQIERVEFAVEARP